MHSMRFSDRTISYDTGLNLMKPVQTGLDLNNDDDLDEIGLVILPHNGAPAPPGKRGPAIKKISTGKPSFNEA